MRASYFWRGIFTSKMSEDGEGGAHDAPSVHSASQDGLREEVARLTATVATLVEAMQLRQGGVSGGAATLRAAGGGGEVTPRAAPDQTFTTAVDSPAGDGSGMVPTAAADNMD